MLWNKSYWNSWQTFKKYGPIILCAVIAHQTVWGGNPETLAKRLLFLFLVLRKLLCLDSCLLVKYREWRGKQWKLSGLWVVQILEFRSMWGEVNFIWHNQFFQKVDFILLISINDKASYCFLSKSSACSFVNSLVLVRFHW